jgi:hypothetical protein
MDRMSRWAWLASLVIGCGHPSAPAAPNPGGRGSNTSSVAADAVETPVALENDLPRLAERAVKLYLDWSVALREAGNDCAQATTKLNAIADANADVIEANRKVLRGDRARIKALRAELDKHQADLDASAKSIFESPTMKKCSTDPGFAKAADRLGGES